MITDMNARVAMAQKLSIPQLQQAIKNGTIPAYVGVPMLQDKMRQQQQMQMAQQGQQAQQQQRPIADEVMDQAYEMNGGVDQLPSNLPIQNEEDDENYAGGGIIAFSGDRTSDVRDPDSIDRRSPTDRGIDELIARINRSANNNIIIPPAANTGIAGTTPEVFSVDGVSPEFGGSTISAAQDTARVAKIQAERAAAEDAQRQRFLRSAAPQLAAPEAPAPERTVDNGMFSGVDSLGADVLPPKAPSGTPSATAPGAVSPATARQIRATNPGVPATLDDAEAAAPKSPQAAAAVSMLDRYVAMLEKSGDDVGRQKKEALYMALIQGGLGMMGGTSPNAFANIAQGMLPATQAYQQAIAGIRKDDRARIEKLINAGLSKEKLGMELKKLGIEEKKVDALVNYYNARAGAAGSGGSDKENRLADQFAESKGIEYDRAAQLARRNMDAALGKNEEYNRAKMILGNKNAKPADLANARKIIKEIETPYLEDISYNRSMAQRYFSRSSKSGGDAPVAGNMPKGIPQGSKQVGTSGGKPVYESPDGKRYIVE
jgi:hypothetical protein